MKKPVYLSITDAQGVLVMHVNLSEYYDLRKSIHGLALLESIKASVESAERQNKDIE